MNGKDSFISALNERGFNGKEIFKYYRDNDIGKFNSVGQFTVKHGAFLDDDVLARAMEAINNDDEMNDQEIPCEYCAEEPVVTANGDSCAVCDGTGIMARSDKAPTDL